MFPTGRSDCEETSDMISVWADLDSGYAQSKWVAEQLVLSAMKRGLPTVVYRLGKGCTSWGGDKPGP